MARSVHLSASIRIRGYILGAFPAKYMASNSIFTGFSAFCILFSSSPKPFLVDKWDSGVDIEPNCAIPDRLFDRIFVHFGRDFVLPGMLRAICGRKPVGYSLYFGLWRRFWPGSGPRWLRSHGLVGYRLNCGVYGPYRVRKLPLQYQGTTLGITNRKAGAGAQAGCCWPLRDDADRTVLDARCGDHDG